MGEAPPRELPPDIDKDQDGQLGATEIADVQTEIISLKRALKANTLTHKEGSPLLTDDQRKGAQARLSLLKSFLPRTQS